jgi:NAD(P)H dehydrogenase (quinone)
MSTIAVTGATGQLGRLVVAALLDRGVARGELATDSGDLQRLIGRPSTPPKLVIEQALA